MGKVILKAIVGLAAGVLAWLLIEPTRPAEMGLAWSAFELRVTGVVGALVGAALGGLTGYYRSASAATRGALLGLVFGTVGIFAGYAIGGMVSAPFRLFPPQIWRTIAIGGIGAGLGFGVGASSLQPRRMIQGLIGGAIGGAVSGFVFDAVGAAFGLTIAASAGTGTTVETGGPSRGLTFAVLGLLVGLFTGLVEEVAKRAWLRLVLGRNEGRDWEVAGLTTIGRDERATVPLFGDPAVAPLHATIERQGAHWIVSDRAGAGVTVNGAPIASAALLPGSVIGIGRFRLEFHVRGARPISAAMPIAVGSPAPGAMALVSTGPAITFLDGPLAGRRFEVGEGLEIGREGAGVALNDPSVSRRHARLSLSPGGLLLEDLGSTNGTFVGSERVVSRLVRIGEVVRLGTIHLRVEP